jgi:glutathionylspermidine synthase
MPYVRLMIGKGGELRSRTKYESCWQNLVTSWKDTKQSLLNQITGRLDLNSRSRGKLIGLKI